MSFPVRLFVFQISMLISASSFAGIINKKDLWADGKNIPVCWYKTNGSKIKKFLQKVTLSAYRKAGVELTGWQNCKKSHQQAIVKIKIAKYGDRLIQAAGYSKVGPSTKGHNGMPLWRGGDFTLFVRDISGLMNFSESKLPKKVQAALDFFYACNYQHNRKACRKFPKAIFKRDKDSFFPSALQRLVKNFLHEVGHAVGMQHEHERYDINESSIPKHCHVKKNVPRETVYRPSNQNNVILFEKGVFDDKAVMSYCAGQLIHLSKTEVRVLREAY